MICPECKKKLSNDDAHSHNCEIPKDFLVKNCFERVTSKIKRKLLDPNTTVEKQLDFLHALEAVCEEAD